MQLIFHFRAEGNVKISTCMREQFMTAKIKICALFKSAL